MPSTGNNFAVLPAGRMDLLTVLAHELGHVLGLEDLDAEVYMDNVMADVLAAGVRRTPTAQDIDLLFATDRRPIR